MKTVADIIKERRTIRAFQDKEVAKETILELLEVSTWAPNHKSREPWRFILYLGDAKKIIKYAVKKAKEDKADGEHHKHHHKSGVQAPCTIIVCMQESDTARENEDDYAAVCALIQNLQLAAWEKGLGCVWKTAPFIREAKFKDLVGVKENEKIVGLIDIGYPENIPTGAIRKEINEILTIVDNIDNFEHKEELE